jgi:type I restriction enzyme S subunit
MNSRVGKAQVEMVQYGAAQKQFNIGHAIDFIFPVPPKEEQRAIVDYLDIEVTGINMLIDKARAIIDLLNEHRTSLISAAVTGKIDVRGA